METIFKELDLAPLDTYADIRAGVMAESMLFATLDPTTRRVKVFTPGTTNT